MRWWPIGINHPLEVSMQVLSEHAIVILQFLPRCPITGREVDVVGQYDKTGAAVGEFSPNDDERLPAHGIVGARDAVCHQCERVGTIQIIGQHPNSQVGVAGKGFG
jgi:hypothetical protein